MTPTGPLPDNAMYVRDKQGNWQLVEWEPGGPRSNVWDMGDKQNEEYRTRWAEYMRGELSESEFLEWYRDADNYQVEHPGRNRSGVDEGIPR